MKTFDYEKAWQDLALPAFKQLPNAATVLLEEVTIVSAELHQGKDLQMIWPDDGGKLREQFERLDNETLSRAAHVVYYFGHWPPSASVAEDAPKSGESWKFSNYADQILRARLGILTYSKAQVSFRIHEGTIRLCYSSNGLWTWHEVAPATDAGKLQADKLADNLRAKLIAAKHGQHDNAACNFMEKIKQLPAWPDLDTSGYMSEESEIELRRAKRMPKPDKEKLIAKLNADFEAKMASEAKERDGFLWLVNHDLPTGNAIYYNHTGRFNFGWRNPITGDSKAQLVKQLDGFPFEYDVQEAKKY